MWKFCLLWICAIFVSDEIGKAEKRKTPISGCLKQLVQSTFRGATHRMIISYYSVWEVARMATYLRLDIVVWSLKIMTVARCSKTLLLKFGFNVASTEKWQTIILTRSGSRVYEMGRVRASELGVKRGGWVICETRKCEWVICETGCEKRSDWSAGIGPFRRLPSTAINQSTTTRAHRNSGGRQRTTRPTANCSMHCSKIRLSK